MSENPGPYMYVLSQWQLDDLRHEWLISDEGDAAVTAAAAAYHETECAYRAERNVLLATVARVEALFSGGPDTPCRTTWVTDYDSGIPVECVEVPMADLVAALPPKGTDASSQWVLDCTLGEAATVNPELRVPAEAVAYTVTRDRVDLATAAGVQAAGLAFENDRITFKYDLGHAMVAILSTLGIKVKS